MHTTISSFVATPVLWRALVCAVAIGVRVMLDEIVPRGHLGRRTTSRM